MALNPINSYSAEPSSPVCAAVGATWYGVLGETKSIYEPMPTIWSHNWGEPDRVGVHFKTNPAGEVRILASLIPRSLGVKLETATVFTTHGFESNGFISIFQKASSGAEAILWTVLIDGKLLCVTQVKTYGPD